MPVSGPCGHNVCWNIQVGTATTLIFLLLSKFEKERESAEKDPISTVKYMYRVLSPSEYNFVQKV